jgi:anti-sigma B factor antagonist
LTEHGSLRQPLEPDFQVTVRAEATGTIVTVAGELDVASCQVLERELATLNEVALVVVDLRGLSFIDSTGLGVLVRAHQRAQQQEQRFGLVRGNGQVDRLLSLTGLDAELLVGDSIEQLLNAS